MVNPKQRERQSTWAVGLGLVINLFLAALKTGEAEQIISENGLPRFTDHTIVDKALYLQELEKVKNRGYAMDDEEYILGVRAAAAPITGLGHLKSAIWVVGFKAGLDDGRMESVALETKKAAQTASRRIQKKLFS